MIAKGTGFFVAQKEDLATHLVQGLTFATRALCGTDIGLYPSYSVRARVGSRGVLKYEDGVPCLHHVDCKRCHAIYTKGTTPGK